jgi:hypothetical protein
MMKTAPMRLHRYPPGTVSAGAQLLLAAVWIWAGLDKAINFDNFQEAVAKQAVLGSKVSTYLGAVPVLEVLLGCGVAAFGARRAWRAGVLALSAATLIVLTIYLLRIPAPVLKSAGCGCGGVASIAPPETHAGAIVRNAVLLLLNLVAMFRVPSAVGELRPIQPAGAQAHRLA